MCPREPVWRVAANGPNTNFFASLRTAKVRWGWTLTTVAWVEGFTCVPMPIAWPG